MLRIGSADSSGQPCEVSQAIDMAAPRFCSPSLMATWCTPSAMCRMTSTLRARGTLFSIAAAAGLCVSVAAAQRGGFVPNHVASPRAPAAAPEGIQGYNSPISFETERLPPWYGQSATTGGYMVPAALTPLHTYVQDIPRSSSVPLSAQAPVHPGRRLAVLRPGINRGQATFDGPADSPPFLALSHDVQQMSPFSAYPFTPASQTFSASDAVAYKPAASRRNLSAASAGSSVVPPLSSLVLLPAVVHSFANGFASHSALQPTADANMPDATPYSSASSFFLSNPSYAVVPNSPLASRNGSVSYAESSTLPPASSSSTFSSESPPRSAPNSATAAPATLRKLLHERRNRKDVSGAVEGLGEKSARGTISKKRSVLGAREIQETREVGEAHNARKVNRTKKACSAPEYWKTTEQEELEGRHIRRRPGPSERRHIRCDGGSDQPSGALLQKQTIRRKSQVDHGKRHEFGSGKQSDGDLLPMQPRRLQQESDSSGDILSNTPEPAALNYAFFRGFGKPRAPSIFGNSPRPASAVAVAGPGFELIQYTSNVDLPIWGAIPNYPINFSTL